MNDEKELNMTWTDDIARHVGSQNDATIKQINFKD
jgi:hypothetical protein